MLPSILFGSTRIWLSCFPGNKHRRKLHFLLMVPYLKGSRTHLGPAFVRKIHFPPTLSTCRMLHEMEPVTTEEPRRVLRTRENSLLRCALVPCPVPVCPCCPLSFFHPTLSLLRDQCLKEYAWPCRALWHQ